MFDYTKNILLGIHPKGHLSEWEKENIVKSSRNHTHFRYKKQMLPEGFLDETNVVYTK